MAKTEKASSRKPTLKEKYLAHHEAGHAAVGHLLGHKITFVSADVAAHPPPEGIELPDGTGGICCGGPALRQGLGNQQFFVDFTQVFIQTAVAHYAGKRGAPNCKGVTIWGSIESDYVVRHDLYERAKCLGLDYYSILAVERFLVRATKVVLDKAWPEVELVANALLGKKFLTEEEIKAILPEDPDPEILEIINQTAETTYDMLASMVARIEPPRAEKAAV